jgi:lipoate-protein ligase B
MIKQLRPCILYKEFGSVTDYQQVWRYQKVLNEHAGKERKKGIDIPDSLILVQHQSLYTLGRGATLDNFKFSPHSPGLQ